MNRLRFNPRYSRALDAAPSRQIYGSVSVGIVGIAAHLTEKLSLRLAVALIAMSTYRTGTRRITGVNLHKRDTGKATLVLKKAFEFVKRPTGEVIALRFFNPYPPSDARQIFNGYAQAVVFSGGNDGLTNNVVRVLSKSGFFARKFFKLAFRRPCAAFLQTTAQTPVLAAYSFNLPTAVGRAEAVRSKLNDTHVNAQIAFDIFGRRLRHFTRRQKIELTAGVNEVALTLLKLQPLQLACPGGVKHFLPTRQRPNRHAKAAEFPLEDASVVSNSAVWPKVTLPFFIQLVRVGYFAFTTNRHLRGQRVLFSDLKVDELMQRKLPESLRTPSYLRDVVTRLVCPFKRRQQTNALFGGGQELYFRRQLHAFILPYFQGVEYMGAYLRGSQFLCQLKLGSLLAALR